MQQVRREVRVGDVTAEVTFKTMKTLRLRVMAPDGRVSVSVPHRTPLPIVEEFISQRQDWIRRKRESVAFVAMPGVPQVDGDRARLWGQWVPIVATDAPSAGAHLVDGRIHLLRDPNRPEEAQRALDAMLVSEMDPVVQDLRRLYEGLLSVSAARIRYRRMRSRWGSCQVRTASITLNTALAEYPPEALEYVVVHELVHLREPGHGPGFRNLMGRVLPDWKERRRRLHGR